MIGTQKTCQRTEKKKNKDNNIRSFLYVQILNLNSFRGVGDSINVTCKTLHNSQRRFKNFKLNVLIIHGKIISNTFFFFFLKKSHVFAEIERLVAYVLFIYRAYIYIDINPNCLSQKIIRVNGNLFSYFGVLVRIIYSYLLTPFSTDPRETFQIIPAAYIIIFISRNPTRTLQFIPIYYIQFKFFFFFTILLYNNLRVSCLTVGMHF